MSTLFIEGFAAANAGSGARVSAEPRNAEEGVQVIRAHANVAAWAATFGHTARAQKHLAMARQFAAGHYGGSGMAFIDCTDALLAWQTGRWDGARIVRRYLNERHPQFSGAIPEFRCMDTVLRFVRGSARHREVIDLFDQLRAARHHEAAGWMAGIAIRHRLSLRAVNEACLITDQARSLLR